MRVELDITKNVQENAERYFESSKKAKRKARGAREAVERIASEGIASNEKPSEAHKQVRPRRWFMEFRWHVTASGVLCVGGRTAETNERVIKRYTNPKDRVFHADVQGSPFYVARTRGRQLSGEEIRGVASSCASFSRAWKYGLASIEVFEVAPEQVTKRARAGEYVSTGSFMVYGERVYHEGALELFATLVRLDGTERVMVSGERLPESFARIAPGEVPPAKAARELSEITSVPTSEIERSMPPGNVLIERIGEPRARALGRIE